MNIRKNQATLSPLEKTRFVNAVLALKANGKYDDFVRMHYSWIDHMDAHMGPAFLPWHREFLLRFERALQAIDPSVTLPYWDWTSPPAGLWDATFLGGDGDPNDNWKVKTGKFAHGGGRWKLAVYPDDEPWPYLRRRFTANLLTDPVVKPGDVDTLLKVTPYDKDPWDHRSKGGFRNELEGWWPFAPSMHNLVHKRIGGSMNPMSSPNDPVFFLHHCFVDKLWADWQRKHPSQPYPPSGTVRYGHGLDDEMRPWDGEAKPPTPRKLLDHLNLGYAYDTDPPLMPWWLAGNTAGFGDLTRASIRLFPGDFTGDGRQDVLFYHVGDHNWWLGRAQGGQLQWGLADTTAGFGNLLRTGIRFFTGDFTGDGRQDVVFYNAGDHNWWLGRSEGLQLGWNRVSVTSDFGDLTRSTIRFFTGDFTGDGRDDIVFYHVSDGHWWLASYGGGQFHWSRVGDTSGFGDLTRSTIRFFRGDFTGDGREDLLFYHAGDGHWWLGSFQAGQLGWSLVSDTDGFGNLTRAGVRFFTGDFTGDGRDDVLFYNAGDGNWWLASLGGGQLGWGLAGNTAGFGDLTRSSIRIFAGNFAGDGRQDILFYHAGDHNWWLGRFQGGPLTWSRIGVTIGFGNLLRTGIRFFTGDFTGDGRDDVLFYHAGDGNWWLGRPATVAG